MNKYSKISELRLSSCHIDLQNLFHEVLKYFDHSIVCGNRSEEDQDKAFNEGKSTKKFPESKHNKYPSIAVDVVPYPIDWKDINRIYLFAGFVLGISRELKRQGIISHDIRWGGDWNSNTETKDNKFNDLVHFELI